MAAMRTTSRRSCASRTADESSSALRCCVEATAGGTRGVVAEGAVPGGV